MARATVNYAQAAVMLSQGLNVDEVAPYVGAKNGNSLRVGLARRGVTPTATRRSDFVIQRAATVANTMLRDESDRIKRDMSELLQNHVSALSQIPAKANLKHIQSVGAALEPLVRSAKVVHGWGGETSTGIVVVGSMKQADPDNAVTDVAATVTLR